MPRRDDPDRKNLILLFYVAAFALLAAALYFFRGEGGSAHGVVEIFVILLFPLGALAYGYLTGDRARSALAATLSYVPLVLAAALATGIQTIFEDPKFAGYHLALLLVLGLTGYCASSKQTLIRTFALILSALWILVFFTGTA
ncbi:hypothetical protein [Methanofollis ethanolicus]|uniref:hypothetical protein n=1 Tax=Methanofollis ethanolicus TaxID=488124 RepID=UPI00082A14D9|nr:hypothetical protein [Methanofollis ethanolicus]